MALTTDQIAALPATPLLDGYAKTARSFFTDYYTCHAKDGQLLEAAKNQFDYLDTKFTGYYLHSGRLFVRSKSHDTIVELSPIMLLLHIRADIKNAKHPLFDSKYYTEGGIDGTYQRQVFQYDRLSKPVIAIQTAAEFKASKLARTKTIDDLLAELSGVKNVSNLANIIDSYTAMLSTEDQIIYDTMIEAEELEAKQLEALTIAFGAEKAAVVLAELKQSGRI
jgi:hypothetical protein